jgi:hypothetical protein
VRRDRDLLGPRARDASAAFSATLEQDVAVAVRAAVVAGNLLRMQARHSAERLLVCSASVIAIQRFGAAAAQVRGAAG